MSRAESTPSADVDELREEIDLIKDAMGIAERYEGVPAQWLLFGVLVALASAISQYVVMNDLPEYWLGIAWIGLLFGGGAVGTWLLVPGEGLSALRARPDEPGIFFVFIVAYLASFPIQVVVYAFVGDPGEPAGMLMTLSIILVMIGLAYLVVGNAMRAYRIRARDRYALHGGGLLLIGLAVAIPFVEFLHTWAYATVGGLYLSYAVVTYVILTRT